MTSKERVAQDERHVSEASERGKARIDELEALLMAQGLNPKRSWGNPDTWLTVGGVNVCASLGLLRVWKGPATMRVHVRAEDAAEDVIGRVEAS